MPIGVYKRIIGVNYNKEKSGFQKGHKLMVGKKHLYKSRKTKGIKLSPEICLKHKEAALKFGFGKWMSSKTGENSNNWKGGINPEHRKFRTGKLYLAWRAEVFSRDSWTCQKCLKRGGDLHAHHIENFSGKKELRCTSSNGITFCVKCHHKFHKMFGIRNNNLEQVLYFIKKRRAN